MSSFSIVVSVVLASGAILVGPACAQAPFATKSGLFQQADSVDLGLSTAVGTETFRIFQAASGTDHYANGVVLIGFKEHLYCQWQSSAIHEDSTDTWVAYSRSADGRTWSAPMKLGVPGNGDYRTSGGWWVNGDTLVGYINVWPLGANPRSGSAYYITSTDGLKWSAPKRVTMSDGTNMAGIFEQDPQALPDGRILTAAHFQPGLLVAPIYTDDKSGVRGWKRATYSNLSVTSDVSREIEPSWYRRSDGAAVMVFRDQSGTYRKLASVSTNRGVTWSKAVLTDMPDSRAKQSAGNLPDGTAFQVNNPVVNKRRSPLAIALSKDGKTFDKAYVLRKGGSDLQAQRYTGKAKTLGYNYPKSTVWNDCLYVGYATNKEDVEITRVPLTAIQLNSTGVGPRSRGDTRIAVSLRGDRLIVETQGAFECEIATIDGRRIGFRGAIDRTDFQIPFRATLLVLRVRTQMGSKEMLVTNTR